MELLTQCRATLRALERERDEKADEMGTIADRAIDAGRNLTDDEARQVDDLKRAMDGLRDKIADTKERVRELETVQRRTSEIAKRPELHVRSAAGHKPWEDVRDWRNGRDLMARATDALGLAGVSDEAIARARAVMEQQLDPRRGEDFNEAAKRFIFASSDDYRTAFLKMALDPLRGHVGFTMAEAEAVRAAMSITTNANGAYLSPTHLDPTLLLTNAGSDNVLRKIARVVTLTQGDTWNGVSTAGVTASFDPELTQVSDDSPNDLAQPSIPVHQAQAFVQYSVQAGDDLLNLENELRRAMFDAKERLEGDKYNNGSGTDEPTGLWTTLDANTNVELVSTTAATIGEVDLHAMYGRLGTRFRRRSRWLMNPTYALAIKRLGTNLSSTYSGDLTEAPMTDILGRPVSIDDDAPSTQTTTVRDNEIVFGDFSNFVIVDRIGLTIELIPHLMGANARPIGARGLYARWRTGSDTVVENADSWVLLQDKTSA